MREPIERLLRQPVDQSMPLDKVIDELIGLAAQCRAKMGNSTAAVPAPAIIGGGAPAVTTAA
jgi:hypothetical protein